MPSTYTNSLRLEKPADGEQATTWGDTVNRVFDLLDFAIGGITTVATTGGAVTLTANNGLADQARAAVIQLTGTLTSNLTLTLPNAARVVQLRNNLVAGGYSLTVQAAGGGGGLVVPGGWGGTLYTDGTVVDVACATATFRSIGLLGTLFTGNTPDPVGAGTPGVSVGSMLAANAALGTAPAARLSSPYSAGTAGSGLIVSLCAGGTSYPVGSITTNGASTAFNTTSDYRAKDRIVPMADGSERLMALRPCRGVYRNEPGREVDMLLAHEVAAVVPEAVNGRKDATDDEGAPILQQLDHSKLVPLLVAALQETMQRVTMLERRIGDLEYLA